MKTENIYKWSTIDRLASTVITFTGNIVLARMLTPDDFGLLAMVGIFSAIAYNMTSCGLSDGLIRKPDPTPLDYSTVFVFNSGLGFLFAIVFIATAPLVAELFSQPPLIAIMRVIGVCFALQSMSLVQETRLRKELRMKALAYVHIAATFCSVGLGILLAWLGYSYWGLVSCRIFLSVFIFLFATIATRWFPKVRFSIKAFKEFFSFGVNLMASYCCHQIARNINATVLGYVSPSASGIYSQAQKMEDVPFAIVDNSVAQTFYPVAAKEQDRMTQRSHILRMFSVSVLINFTLVAFMLIVSRPGFLILFGHKWVDAIDVFRILLIFGFFYNMKSFIIQVLKLRSKTNIVRNLTFLEVVIQLIALFSLYRYGILWTAVSQVIATALTSTIYMHYLHRFEEQTWTQLIKRAVVPLIAPVAAFLFTSVAYLMTREVLGEWILAILCTVVFFVTFLLTARLRPMPEYGMLLRKRQ